MAQKFAVFDIDGTIIRTALFFQIVDELIALGHLSSTLRTQLDAKQEAYNTRTHPEAFRDYNEMIVDVLFSNLATVKVADYRAAVDTVIERSHAHVYVYTRDLIKQLKSQNYFLIAISGSEFYAIKKFTEYYAFDIVKGDRYEEESGHFTGKIDSVFFDKGKALQEIIQQHNLTYEGSMAIGDSIGDAKMLELVEQPIAFNPEAKLLNLAKDMGWKVVVERKNVVYTLEPKDGSYVLAQAN